MRLRRLAAAVLSAYCLLAPFQRVGTGVAARGLLAQPLGGEQGRTARGPEHVEGQPPAQPAEDAALQKKITALVAQLSGNDMRGQVVARNASRELVKIGKPAVPALLEAAKSQNPNVRWWALGTLASIGDPAAIETFLACLKDSDTRVRCMAVYQSRRFISDERIRSALLGMPLQADTETRRALLLSFIESNFTPAIPVLKEGLKSADPQARADFLETFTKLDKAGAFDALRGVLTSDPDERVRASAVICLDNLLPPGKPPRRFLALLISALDDRSLKVQYTAVSRLCRLTGQKSMFSAQSSVEERAQAIKQLKDWWAKAAPTFPD
jgi:HEAT repeat protein